MPSRFDLVTLNVADPVLMATFWCAALDLHETEREDGGRWIVLSGPDGTRRLGLQRGVSRPGSIHLDLVCAPDEFESEVSRLVDLGAVAEQPPRVEPYGYIVNLTDPEGNPFDLCAYASVGRQP